MPHCHWWGLLFLFFFLQENNKIRLTATGGAFFYFFLQKNINVRSNHHKLFYRWIWDKFLLVLIFLFLLVEKSMFLSKFITNISITHHIRCLWNNLWLLNFDFAIFQSKFRTITLFYHSLTALILQMVET